MKPTRAVVLRRVDVGEADRILSVLTAERGRVEVRVPSARRSRKRFGGVDLYTLVDADLDDSRRSTRMTAAAVVDAYPGIREDVLRLALAGRAAELLHQAAPEGQASGELMRLAVAAFGSLDVPGEAAVGGRGWARAFELKLAHVLGVRPSLIRCAACAASIDDGPAAWSPTHGGALVGTCRDLDPAARSVAASTLRRLHEALHRPLAEQVAVAWGADEAPAEDAMSRYMDEHVGRRRKARDFLESVLRPLAVATLVLGVFSGCTVSGPETDVRVQGWLFDTETPAEDALPIPGATLSAFDDEGALLDEGGEPFESAPGFYRVSNLPLDTAVHLEFGPPEAVDEAGEAIASDHVSTVRSGRSASNDLFVDDGVFVLGTAAALLEDLAAMNDAGATYVDPDPDVPDQGGALRARILASEVLVGERFRVVDAAGVGAEVFYRVDGAVVAEAGVDATGEFLVAGLPAGPIDVELLDEAGAPTGRLYRTRAVEDGVTVLLDFVP